MRRVSDDAIVYALTQCVRVNQLLSAFAPARPRLVCSDEKTLKTSGRALPFSPMKLSTIATQYRAAAPHIHVYSARFINGYDC